MVTDGDADPAAAAARAGGAAQAACAARMTAEHAAAAKHAAAAAAAAALGTTVHDDSVTRETERTTVMQVEATAQHRLPSLFSIGAKQLRYVLKR